MMKALPNALHRPLMMPCLYHTATHPATSLHSRAFGWEPQLPSLVSINYVLTTQGCCSRKPMLLLPNEAGQSSDQGPRYCPTPLPLLRRPSLKQLCARAHSTLPVAHLLRWLGGEICLTLPLAPSAPRCAASPAGGVHPGRASRIERI